MRKDYYNMQQITVLHQEIDNKYTNEMVYLIFVTVLQKASRKRAIFFSFFIALIQIVLAWEYKPRDF